MTILTLGEDAELAIGMKDFGEAGVDPYTAEPYHIIRMDPFISIRPHARPEVTLRMTNKQTKEIVQGLRHVWPEATREEERRMEREEFEMRVEIYIFGRYQGQADFRTIERNRKGRAERILEVLRDPPEDNRNIRMRLNLDKIYEDYQQHGDIKKTLQQVEKKIKKEA